MMNDFPESSLGHVSAQQASGNAAYTVLAPENFAAAQNEITQWEGYAPTPLHTLPALAAQLGVADILYKDEGPRFGLGSFKALGGSYAAQRVLQREVARTTGQPVSLADIRRGDYAKECAAITLVSATDGNHGRSLAWGCQRFGAPCRIYIHAEVSEGRAAAMADLGATVIRIDGDYDASVALSKSEAEANGWLIVSDTSWPGYHQPPIDVMSGYGVMTQEICEALDRPPTHVFLQGGVGGLAAGVIAGLRQNWGEDTPRAVIVEPELAACLFESAKTGKATDVVIAEETIMAGLSCGEPSELAWEIISEEVGDFLTVPDDLVAPVVRRLARPLDGDPVIEAGESAVAGLAAVMATSQNAEMSEKLGLDAAARVLLIGSEGVTDQTIFDRIMEGDDAV